MSIDMLADPHKLDFEEAGHSRRTHVLGSLLAMLMITLLVLGGVHLSNPDTMPIKQVRIEGDFTRLSPVDLQLLVTDKVRGGFFSLNVDAVRDALLAEPWVSQVKVNRIWPDALRVIVTEQVPAVRWKEKGLLNLEGVYFEPELESIPLNLPKLAGPAGLEKTLLQRFNAMQQLVTTVGFRIAALTVDERRAWSLTLNNGIRVVLGRRDFEERFERFLKLIPATLSGRVEQTDSIDMRYTNGFSIKWKK